jgi:hypothetical protein
VPKDNSGVPDNSEDTSVPKDNSGDLKDNAPGDEAPSDNAPGDMDTTSHDEAQGQGNGGNKDSVTNSGLPVVPARPSLGDTPTRDEHNSAQGDSRAPAWPTVGAGAVLYYFDVTRPYWQEQGSIWEITAFYVFNRRTNHIGVVRVPTFAANLSDLRVHLADSPDLQLLWSPHVPPYPLSREYNTGQNITVLAAEVRSQPRQVPQPPPQ